MRRGGAGHNGPVAGPVFRRDLYRGTARDYERFRVPYPPGLTADLADRAGFALSTSVLSRAVLGGRAGDFAADLRRELHASQPDGRFRQTIDFACDLARRPA